MKKSILLFPAAAMLGLISCTTVVHEPVPATTSTTVHETTAVTRPVTATETTTTRTSGGY